MDTKTAKKPEYSPFCLSRLKKCTAILLVTSIYGSHAKSDGIPQLSEPNGAAVSQFYRINTPSRPRLGFVVSPLSVNGGIGNFEFCNGERITIELVELEEVDETCATDRVNVFKLATFFANPKGALLYDEQYTFIGEIVSANIAVNYPLISEYTINLNPDIFSLVPSTRVIELDPNYMDVQLSSDGKFTILVRNSEAVYGLNWNMIPN